MATRKAKAPAKPAVINQAIETVPLEAPDDDELVFRGSIAQLQNAITFGADGGMRVRVDVPQSYRIAGAALIEVQGCELEFRVRVVKQDEQNNQPTEPVKRSSAKQRIR